MVYVDDLKNREATEEGWTLNDGKEAVTKRTVRQVTTTHSEITGMEIGGLFEFGTVRSHSKSFGGVSHSVNGVSLKVL